MPTRDSGEPPKPHIFLIAYYFPPHSGIGGIRPFRFYKYLKKLGYPCTVITASAQPAGTPDDIVVIPDNIGKIWASDRKQELTAAAHLERLVRRYAIPACTGFVWAWDVAALCIRLLRRHPSGTPVVVFTTYPPLGTLLAGLAVSWRSRARWICDFRDPLSLGLAVKERSPFSRYLARWLEVRAFRGAAAVVANTRAMAAEWLGTYPWSRLKLHVIFNGFDPEQQPRAREIPPRPSRIFLHAGELYAGRSPQMILESLSRLRRTCPEARSVHILLQGSIGYAAGLNQSRVQEWVGEGWLEVRDGNVPRPEAVRMTEEADGLLLIQPQSAIQIPGKLFDYVCVGRPILALVPRKSAVEDALRQADLPNVCVYADDPPPVVDRKLLEYLALPPEPVRFSPVFEAEFSAVRQTGQLVAIIDSVARPVRL